MMVMVYICFNNDKVSLEINKPWYYSLWGKEDFILKWLGVYLFMGDNIYVLYI